ncbi:hypothetical protein IT402_01355 [Candidatus Nomurabacteria bacterium]|nr:hypothetical protein [Candidatus Nomurabacteria bacterium]
MKKIFFSLTLLFFSSLSSKGQKYEVDHFEVDQSGMATVYLVNENNQTKTVTIRALINPDTRGRNARLTGRQGLLLSPIIRPGGWEQNNYGETVCQGFSYNLGFTASFATVYIIEGSWNQDGTKISYSGREESVIYNTPNPSDWVNKYGVGEYEIPNFTQSVTVNKVDTRYIGNF